MVNQSKLSFTHNGQHATLKTTKIAKQRLLLQKVKHYQDNLIKSWEKSRNKLATTEKCSTMNTTIKDYFKVNWNKIEQ